jgi:hypothetical protein
MDEYVCLVGLDEPEYREIEACLDVPVLAFETLPRIRVDDGQLWVEAKHSARFLPVSKVVFHGIFEHDLDFIAGLALWGGECLPNARGMLDCRLKIPCLVRALQHTRFGMPRGFVSPHTYFESPTERVAKWGNWHCGENKALFSGEFSNDEAAIIEDYLVGQAVRVVLIGDQHWQIRLEGEDWLKSIHHADAAFIPVDGDLLDDTRRIREAFGLEIIANDYIVTDEGDKFLLEVNHIPNVTRFPQIWEAYRDFVVAWLGVPVLA